MGLIGASLALALRGKYRIVGVDSDKSTCDYALKHGIVEEIRTIESLRGVDCVIVCTPLKVLRDTVLRVYEAVGDGALITDAGSVKGNLLSLPGRIVGGHPMAGTEHSGIAHAKPHLFEHAYYCVVPYENSRSQDVETVCEIARAAGAEPVIISPIEHDEAVAAYSHAPHIAAYALSASAIGESATLAGSGFSDCTRIALSDPDFWAEVCRLNRENTLSALDKYISELNGMREALRGEDYGLLREKMRSANIKRKNLSLAREFDSSLTLTVDVLDEVGSIGAVTAAVMKAGVNIANIRILDSREGAPGALMLEFATRRDSAAAIKALVSAGYAVSGGN